MYANVIESRIPCTIFREASIRSKKKGMFGMTRVCFVVLMEIHMTFSAQSISSVIGVQAEE